VLRRHGAIIAVCIIVLSAAGCGGGGSGFTARDLADTAGVARDVTTEGENCVFDYNGDGVPDLFVSNHDQAPWQLFKGLPDGTFLPVDVGTFPLRDRHGCAIGDFNGDGLPDIYASIGACMGMCRAPKELWIQTPGGGFVNRAGQFGVSNPDGRGRAPITLNADGDKWPDLFTGEEPGLRYPSHNKLWVNADGRRFANIPGAPDQNIGAQCATAGDVEGDGTDVLIVCGNQTFRIYDLEHGKWSDVTAALGLPTWARGDAELADVNGDGKLDLLTVYRRGFEVRLNRGGRFGTPDYTHPLTDGRDLAIGDADGDGDPDVYIVQSENGTSSDQLLLNQGSGTSYASFSGLPQATTGQGDTAQAIPNYKGTGRSAFLVNNGAQYPMRGPRQLIFLEQG
jgi:FG-GAP-like repeat